MSIQQSQEDSSTQPKPRPYERRLSSNPSVSQRPQVTISESSQVIENSAHFRVGAFQ